MLNLCRRYLVSVKQEPHWTSRVSHEPNPGFGALREGLGNSGACLCAWKSTARGNFWVFNVAQQMGCARSLSAQHHLRRPGSPFLAQQERHSSVVVFCVTPHSSCWAACALKVTLHSSHEQTGCVPGQNIPAQKSAPLRAPKMTEFQWGFILQNERCCLTVKYCSIKFSPWQIHYWGLLRQIRAGWWQCVVIKLQYSKM